MGQLQPGTSSITKNIGLMHTPRLTRGAKGCAVLTTLAFAAVSTYRLPSSLSPSRATSPRMSSTRTDVQIGGGSGVVRNCRKPATAAIIFMHGLGDTAAGWAGAFPLLDHVRAVVPTADQMPVTLNGGMRMPSWFDISSLDGSAPDDQAGILGAVARVNNIINEQIAGGIPANRIVVAGFSQGGAVALTTGMRTNHRLAGIVGMSSWLPLHKTYPGEMSAHAKEVPVLLCHGTDDMVVRYSFGKTSAQMLKGLGFNVSFKSYAGMGHSACDEEIYDLKSFLASAVPEEK